MRISACQMISGIDPEQNVLDAVNLISASADSGADLVVLPENFALMAGDAANLGIAEAVGEGPIQDPEGNIAARYDRIHLFRLQNKTEFYDERIYIEPGKSPVTFRMTTWDGESFSVGLSLGFDLRFPELFRGLSQPDLIVLPATFTEMTGRAHWATLLAARAIENQCFVAAAAQGGHHACGRRTWGHSRIIDAWGGMVSELASGTGIVIGNIERSQLENVRSTLPALASRTIY